MQIITSISKACEIARRNFTRGEQSMLIEIFNGTALTPERLGQHLFAAVEDSFDLYPGHYEKKWGINRKEMIDKIISLDPLAAAFLELWAVGFWDISTNEPGQLDDYLSGKLTLAVWMENIVRRLQQERD